MAGNKEGRDKLLAKDPDYFSNLAKKAKGKPSPKKGSGSIEEKKRRWIALKGVVARGHTLQPHLQEEFDELDALFANGIRTSIRRHPKVFEALTKVLDD